ncbi:MAG: hypothetical protein H6810_12785 [Phycisphaeraceae bacterium]|nr:MAG: hypothetical protein H6810_12785 [Phycisphaeraceae bacterium]
MREQSRGGAPEVSPALRELLAADYLTDEERLALRVDHGLWEEGDLATPAMRAKAALIAGAVTDPVFDDQSVDPLDRAEAALRRGEPERTLELSGNDASLRAAWLRAQASFDLGRFTDADDAVQPVVDRMVGEKIENAGELADGVRALMIRATIRGSAQAKGGDYQTLKTILERARDELDRMSWRVRLVEGELLYDKHNSADAAAALAEVLTLNPRCAEAEALLGRIAVDGFAFEQAEQAAIDLDRLADSFGQPSADAALIRGRMRLRQRAPAGAAEIVGPVREKLPHQRALLALDAAIAASAFDDARSRRLLAEFEELAPGSPVGVFEVGRWQAENRQYDDAIATLRKATIGLEHWSHPWIELGLVLIQAGRDQEAEAALEKAVSLDPFNARAKNSLELVRGLKDFTTVESEHFVVRYLPGIDKILAKEMLPVLERIHARVCADPEKVPGGIGYEPAQKTLIELMPSHRWFSVRITGMTRVHTMAAATGPVIAMESPQEGPEFTVGPYDWPRVIQHEYTHTVTLARTRNRIPHWFTEAAAVYNEDGPRDEQTWRLLARVFHTDALFDLDEINTAFVRPKQPTDRAQAYAQGHWMYQFIIDRWGPSAPVKLMDRYAAGEAEASAFEAELGVSKDEFMSAFRGWAQADLRRVGLALPEDVPSVVEMLKADRREAADPDSVTPDMAFVERWRAQYPRHPELIELLESLRLLEVNDEKEARLEPDVVDTLELLADVVPVAEQPHRLLARHYLAGENRVKAIPHLEFLDAREQNSAVYATELARLYADQGEWAKAQRKAERAAEISPFDADVREFAARVDLKIAVDGDHSAFADAERHIEALTVLEPGVELHKRRLERVKEMAGG